MNKNGRERGSKNKYGAQAKENIVAVFTRLGGTAAMADWAKENRTDFYRIYAQLVPKEAHVDVRITEETSLTDAELAAIATAGRAAVAEPPSGEGETSELH